MKSFVYISYIAVKYRDATLIAIIKFIVMSSIYIEFSIYIVKLRR